MHKSSQFFTQIVPHRRHYVCPCIKMLMAGANVTMLCSALFRYGIPRITVIENGLRQWMEEHEYKSVEQMQGSISQMKCENPSAYERAQYIRILQQQVPRPPGRGKRERSTEANIF